MIISTTVEVGLAMFSVNVNGPTFSVLFRGNTEPESVKTNMIEMSKIYKNIEKIKI